ncbi:MAG: hypothetical protein EOP52_09470 [Sphingobacteriales bacterium]|nr:MAG: hypothetical protein EOP52_09470 [Sphingobacteriales bacterium]
MSIPFIPNHVKEDSVKAFTVEELMASGQFDNFSEADIKTLLETIRAFTEIVYSLWSKQQCTEVIPFQPNHQKVA